MVASSSSSFPMRAIGTLARGLGPQLGVLFEGPDRLIRAKKSRSQGDDMQPSWSPFDSQLAGKAEYRRLAGYVRRLRDAAGGADAVHRRDIDDLAGARAQHGTRGALRAI